MYTCRLKQLIVDDELTETHATQQYSKDTAEPWLQTAETISYFLLQWQFLSRDSCGEERRNTKLDHTVVQVVENDREKFPHMDDDQLYGLKSNICNATVKQRHSGTMHVNSRNHLMFPAPIAVPVQGQLWRRKEEDKVITLLQVNLESTCTCLTYV